MTATENLDYTSRTITAHGRRNESVRRWLESETARASCMRSDENFKIRFEDGTMLLSAVASGDIEETKRLLDAGANVNYANIDGLTSLHQACIDENIEMVELLVSRGAMLDACDNEGWTPLHAAASTTALDVITYLVESGANIASVNTEGEVPLDLAEEPEIQMFLSDEVRKRNVDLDAARSSEHRQMLNDALQWQSDGVMNETLDSQGATALHVASSKGYIDVVKILLDIGANVNCSDCDGWTPLHAAVYWKQQAVCELLLQNGAKIYARSNIGQSPIDLAEDEMVPFMRSLARNYKATEGFGGPDKINRSSPSVVNTTIRKPTKNIVGIIKTQKNVVEDKPLTVVPPPVVPAPIPPTPQLDNKKETVPQSVSISHPPTSIVRPPKPVVPPTTTTTTTTTSKIPNKISLPPTTPTIPTSVEKTQPSVNDQAKLPDKVVTKVPFPQSTPPILPPTSKTTVKKEPTAISKPPTTTSSIPKPELSTPNSTISRPITPVLPVTSPAKPPTVESSVNVQKSAIVRPPISTTQKTTTVVQQPEKDKQILEQDYTNSVQQLAALKNELVAVIKERDMLKSKLEKAESDLINYHKLLEENVRLSKENSSLVKVIATFNRSSSHPDKNASGNSS